MARQIENKELMGIVTALDFIEQYFDLNDTGKAEWILEQRGMYEQDGYKKYPFIFKGDIPAMKRLLKTALKQLETYEGVKE